MNTQSITGYMIDREAFGQAKNLFKQREGELSEQALRTLAHEVITRLRGHLDHPSLIESPPCDAEIEALCAALMSEDDTRAPDLVLQARRDGMSVDMICLGLIAGAARRLGEWWSDDRVSFIEMALAASRMYALLRGLRQVFPPIVPPVDQQIPVCFVSVPGENHTLGVTMAADLFRRRGWKIDLKNGFSHDDLLAEIGQRRYGIIGISAGSERMLLPLIRLKIALRISNPQALIMICGKITEVVPDLAARVDADYVATDVASSIDQMQKLMQAAATGAKEMPGA